jgi:uncharacterized lipoprotein YbaY
MRKSEILILLGCFFMISACKKNILSNTGTSVDFVNGGLSHFDDEAINYTGDTTVVNFTVALNPSSIKENLTINIGINDPARIAYNSTSTTLLYDSLPSAGYSLAVKSAVINSGSVSVNFSISFYHLNIDPRISYMLPVSITDAEGLAITDSLSTIYFHVNGNFLSASYDNTGTKTEYIGQDTSSVLDIITCPDFKFFAAISPAVSAIDYADLGAEGWQYLITVDSVTNTLVSVVPNSIILGPNGALPGSFVVDTATYNNAAGVFHFVTHYSDLDSNLRVVNETLTKQQ